MRYVPLFLFLAAACAPVSPAQVTKGNVAEDVAATGLPPVSRFGLERAPAARRPNAEMAADFLDLEFHMESGKELPVLTRFEGPVTLGFAGAVPATAPGDLAQLMARLRSEAGLDVRLAGPDRSPSITIAFVPKAELRRLVPTAACFVVPQVSSLAEYRALRSNRAIDWARLQRRDRATVFLPGDASPQEVRDCLHEEIAQALGPVNDLYRLPDSVFNDDNFQSVLTGFDMLMLRLHYAPELQSGMTEAEVAARLPALIARLNPAGGSAAAVGGSPTPRAWIDAVATALSPSGSHDERMAAARRMLSVATSQGWSDNRLGFAWFAIGRLEAAHDPAAAAQAFQMAGQIYRSLPDGGIHAAHADMQLAALALAAGRLDEVVALTDRAMPVVKQAQNAALLATLMLLKSEALGLQGHVAEARELRLDSLGWAGYGFGSAPEIRAHVAEIAALAARGTQG